MATNHPKLLILGNCLESGCESRHVYLSFICIHNQKMVIDNVHTVFTMCCMAMSLTWRLWSPVVISYFKNVCIVQLLCISAMLLDTFTCVTVVSWLARVKHIHHIYSVPVLMTSSDIIWCCLLAVMWWFMICQFADVWLQSYTLSYGFCCRSSLAHKVYKRHVDRSSFSYQCSRCSKSFQKPSQLERHLRIHTGICSVVDVLASQQNCDML